MIESPQARREREIRERQLEIKEQEIAVKLAKLSSSMPENQEKAEKRSQQIPNPLLAARLYGLGILPDEVIEQMSNVSRKAYDKLKKNKPIIADIEKAYSMSDHVDIRDILKYRMLEVAMFAEDVGDLEDIKGILALVVTKPSTSSKIEDNVGGGIEGLLIDAAQ